MKPIDSCVAFNGFKCSTDGLAKESIYSWKIGCYFAPFAIIIVSYSRLSFPLFFFLYGARILNFQRSEWITRWNFICRMNFYGIQYMYANHLRDYNRIKLNIRINFPYKMAHIVQFVMQQPDFFAVLFLYYREKNI